MGSREVLPPKRRCISQKVKIDNQTVHYSIGLYPDGRPGELFIEVSKAGAALRTWAGEAAMILSVALQYGTPLDTAIKLFVGSRSDPSGRVHGHPCITRCTSIMDLIARDMAITFLQRTELADLPTSSSSLIVESFRNAGTPLDAQTGTDTHINATEESPIDCEGVCESTEQVCSSCNEEVTRSESDYPTSSPALIDQA